jgi:hypothetical protein
MIYSIDFLSRRFCDKSRNWRLLAFKEIVCKCSEKEIRKECTFLRKAPMSLKAGAFSLRFDATERKESDPGIRSECKMGLRIWRYYEFINM